MSNYEADITNIVMNGDLSRAQVIEELGEMIDGIESEAFQAGRAEVEAEDKDERDDALNRVKAEFLEIIDSFTRRDLKDVRMRLIDLGSKTFGMNTWIPRAR